MEDTTKRSLKGHMARLSAIALSLVMICQTAAFAAVTISSDTTASGTTYSSATASENALLVSGGTVSLSGITVTKSGSSSGGDSDNFYGTNSAVLAKGGAVLTISDSTVTSDANGANGVFSYGGNGGSNGASGDGTTVTVKDSSITTSGNNAGGIMTTGGGIMNAEDLTINTSGNSSAAIRTDRGGGTVTVDGGSYTSTGVGSPAIYSTADISVSNASLKTTKSEAIVIEGKNSVSLTDCTVDGNNTTKNGKSTTYENVKIYQSMSGDAASGTAVFTIKGGSMTCGTGTMFHVTNTSAVINLSGAELKNSSDGTLLIAGADSWGTSGSNGGNVTLNAAAQTLEGVITVDSISTLNLIMSGGSSYSGAINTSGQTGSVYVEVPEDCTWTLSGDSYITSLTCASGSIDLNGHMLYVNGTAYTEGTDSTGSETSGADSGSETGPEGTGTNDSQPGQPSQDGNGNEPGDQAQSGQQPPEIPTTPATRITKLKKAKKAFTVKWKKVTEADGYQIQYSTKKNFSSKKTVTVKKNTVTSKKIKKLKAKKRYYVRIRTYKVVNGKRVYSAWSTVKAVKTK